MEALNYILAAAAEGLPSAGGDWGDVLKTYGYAAPFILFLLYVAREQRADLKKRDEKIDSLVAKITDDVIPLITESGIALKESSEIAKESADSASQALLSVDRLEASITRLEDLARSLKEA